MSNTAYKDNVASRQSVIAVWRGSSDASLIRDSLGRDGIAVREVPSSDEALRLLETEPDSVILYDADAAEPWQDALPRLLNGRPDVNVVLLTQSADRQTWLDLFDSGGFDLLLRPVQPADLRSVVRCALDPPTYLLASAA
jgi:DNA-binding NtrC family response regulator